jgi:hypothetical protein
MLIEVLFDTDDTSNVSLCTFGDELQGKDLYKFITAVARLLQAYSNVNEDKLQKLIQDGLDAQFLIHGKPETKN